MNARASAGERPCRIGPGPLRWQTAAMPRRARRRVASPARAFGRPPGAKALVELPEKLLGRALPPGKRGPEMKAKGQET